MSEKPAGDEVVAAMSRQAMAELLLDHAEHFSVTDRALVRGVYQHGMKATALAHALGHSPKTVRERLRRLSRRMSSPLFRFVMHHRSQWPERRRAIADAVLLRGQSQRVTASALGVSQYIVRRELDRVRLLSEHQQQSRR